MDFNVVDIIVMLLLFIFSIKGYWSGLIKQITTIIAIVLGIYIAAEQYSVFADFIQQKLDFSLQIANLFSFGLIILVVGIVINYLGQAVSKMLDLLFLSIIDNLGGALFGLIKGSLIVYIMVLMIVKLGNSLAWEGLQQQINSSYFVPKFLDLNPILEKKINQFLK